MKSKNIKLFYIHELLFQFSDSMLVIVLPIFIYKLFGSISAVFVFILTWNLIYSASFIPIFNLAMKLKNPKYFMAIGMFFYVLALWLFGQITNENISLMIPATIFFSLYISFYWMIRHWFFSVNADYTKIGKQISTLTIIRIIISFIAPIIGGAISFLFSFNITFILGAFAAFLCLIPVLMFYAPPHPSGYSFDKVVRILKKPELKAIRLTYVFEALTSIFVHNVWVLIFAIFIGNIMKFGLLVGFTTLAAAVLTWFSGKWFDQKKRTTMLTKLTKVRLAAILLYTTLFFYPNMIWVTIVELVNRLSLSMHITIGDSYLFAYSSKVHPIHFHLNREVHLNIGRIFASALLAVMFYFLPASYLWMVITIGAFCILGFLNLKRSDHLLS